MRTATETATDNIGVFYEAIDLDTITPSKSNPRKHLDEGELQELAASIKDKGVIQPIVIRPHTGGKPQWEIVAGERRWRASKIAGVGSIPAIARNLDDRAVLEIQVIENLQRADIHPLDEAHGYSELLDKHGYMTETIAAKVGKSESYIYQRLKLAELIPAAQKLFLEAVINAGHAILIARLSSDEQKEVLDENNGLLWSDDWYERNDPHPCSVRRLAQEIKRNLYLDLARAPWKQNDTKLLPAAGPCTTCPKRSGANPGLFAEIAEKNICTDRKCYNEKLDAFMKRELEDGGLIKISSEYSGKKTDGVLMGREYHDVYNKDDRCKFTQKAIVVQGHGRGATKDVCIDKTCTKHHSRASGSSSGNDDWKARQRAEQKKRNIELERRRRIFKAVMEKVPAKLGRPELELIAKAAWKRQMSDHQKLIMKAYGGLEPKKTDHGGYSSYDCDKPAFDYIDKAKDGELIKFMIATALGPDLTANSFDYGSKGESLLQMAKRYKINIDKITNDLKTEIKAKAKKNRPVKTSAKSENDSDVEGETL